MMRLDKQGKMVLLGSLGFFIINALFILLCLLGTIEKVDIEKYIQHDYGIEVIIQELDHTYCTEGVNKDMFVYSMVAENKQTHVKYDIEMKGADDIIQKMSCTIRDEEGNLLVVKDNLGNIQYLAKVE